MQKDDEMITQEQIKELFDYKNGNLHWKTRSAIRIKVGDITGSLGNHGYLVTSIKGKLYMTHRLIFLYHQGYLPEFIDHINGNKTDNRIENLRPASSSENNRNAKLRKDNKLGIKNLSKDKNGYMVRIQVNGKSKYIGTFKDLELAKLVAVEARSKYHKEFANNG